MSAIGAGDLTPRTMPAVDRRRPDRHPESVPVLREAMDAAIAEGRIFFESGQGLPNAIAGGALAYLRKLREIARRGAGYSLGGGRDYLKGVHVADVKVALDEMVKFGGLDDIRGPIIEDAMARALAAVDAARAERLARMASSCRRVDTRARIDAELGAARDRAAVRVTVASSRR